MTMILYRGLTSGASAGYGEAELPSFGAGYAAHWLGTKLTINPTRNLFGGAAATLVGTPGTVGLLATNETSYLELPDFSRTIFTAANAVTLIVVGKGVTLTQMLGDDRASSSSMSLNISAGNTNVYATDANGAVVNTNSASSATYGTTTDDRWTLWGVTMTQTAVQTFIQRNALARAVGATVTRTAGNLGSTTKKLRFGRGYSSATASGTAVFVGVWQKVLASDEIDRVYAFLARQMAEIGETL